MLIFQHLLLTLIQINKHSADKLTLPWLSCNLTAGHTPRPEGAADWLIAVECLWCGFSRQVNTAVLRSTDQSTWYRRHRNVPYVYVRFNRSRKSLETCDSGEGTYSMVHSHQFTCTAVLLVLVKPLLQLNVFMSLNMTQRKNPVRLPNVLVTCTNDHCTLTLHGGSLLLRRYDSFHGD